MNPRKRTTFAGRLVGAGTGLIVAVAAVSVSGTPLTNASVAPTNSASAVDARAATTLSVQGVTAHGFYYGIRTAAACDEGAMESALRGAVAGVTLLAPERGGNVPSAIAAIVSVCVGV